MKKLALALLPSLLLMPLTLARADEPTPAPTTTTQTTNTQTPPTPEKPVQAAFEVMMDAIQENDYNAFLTVVDEDFRTAIQRPIFDKVVDLVGKRQKAGYEATFLGELKQSGYSVNLWKLSFQDKGDDLVAQLSWKDGKVGGFFVR